MLWKFWENGKANEGEERLPGPKSLPETIGTYLVVNEKQKPDWVWQLKGVVRPANKKKAFYCRVFNDALTAKAGIKVKDWRSLDEHPDFILWEFYLDNETRKARIEKFVKS